MAKIGARNVVSPIRTTINQALRYNTDPVYRAQQQGRNISGYSSGTTGGPVVHQYAAGGNNNGGGGSGSGTLRSSSGSGNTKANASYSGSISSSFDLAGYLASARAAAQAAADEAYNRNMARIAGAYDTAAGNLSSNYDSTVDRLNAARDSSMKDVKGDAEKSLRQAYVNNMLSKRDLNQRLSAMGYNGGATESTMASMANQYGNSRNEINDTLNKNISALDLSYGDNLAQALQAYNSALSNLDMQRMQLEMQAENARQNAFSNYTSGYESLLDMDTSYLAALQDALANQTAYAYEATEATNPYNPASVQQANAATQATAAALAQAQDMLKRGASAAQIEQNFYPQIASGAMSIETLNDILRKLGR